MIFKIYLVPYKDCIRFVYFVLLLDTFKAGLRFRLSFDCDKTSASQKIFGMNYLSLGRLKAN